MSNNRDGKKECQVTCNSYEYMTHLEWLVRNDTKTVVVFFAL